MRRLISLPLFFAPLLATVGCSEPACHGDCGDAHGDVTGGVDTGATGEETETGEEESLPQQYCECMLDRCHETYHDRWTGDHLEAEQKCLAEASAVPEAGMATMQGNFIECRLQHCEAAQSEPGVDDSENCPPAVGDGVCE